MSAAPPTGDRFIAEIACPNCNRPTKVTVMHTAVIQVVNSRTGALQPRTIERTMCLRCGGADVVERAEPNPSMPTVKLSSGKNSKSATKSRKASQ